MMNGNTDDALIKKFKIKTYFFYYLFTKEPNLRIDKFVI